MMCDAGGAQPGGLDAANVLLVAAGGAVGAALRVHLGLAIVAWSLPRCSRVPRVFPAATLLVNLTGSLIVGLVLGLHARGRAQSPVVSALVATGFCGGLTTMSTFCADAQRLHFARQYAVAAVYVAATVVGSMACAYVGWLLGSVP